MAASAFPEKGEGAAAEDLVVHRDTFTSAVQRSSFPI